MSIPKPTQQEQFPKQNTSNGSMDAFVCKADVTKSEILWTLKLITTHQPYKFADSDKLLKRMFPDSSIAKKNPCGEKRLSMFLYMVSLNILQ